MHTNDCIQAVTGNVHIQTGLLAYYKANGAVSDDLQDAEREFLIAQGATPGQHNQDMWVEYLTSIVGSPATTDLQDLWNWYWCVNQIP